VVAVALLLARSFWLILVLAFTACGGNDRNAGTGTQSGSPIAIAGPRAFVMRVPKSGGAPRVYGYPKVDSLVWASADPAPTPAEVLAFDHNSGSLAYADARGRPVLLELRLGTIAVSNKKLTGLASSDGAAIYGITDKGDVVRVTPTGEWTYKPPQPANTLFPQPDGELLISVGSGAKRRLLKIIPPEGRIRDSVAFPVASRTSRSQISDRLYLAVDSGLVVLRTRTMDWAPPIAFKEPIEVMASTPSGDRVFVLPQSRKSIAVVDRYQDRVKGVVELPGKADDLRVDPFGRYLLVRAADGDSIWVVAIGTERLIGSVRGVWRKDLPFVGSDGAVAVASGNDIVFYDGETLKPKSRIRNAANEFWHPLVWDGFRPRSASLDVPVRFDTSVVGARDTSVAPDSVVTVDTVVTDSTTAQGFIVSFAALLAEDRAKELAARIRVGGETARVVARQRGDATIYRVVLGPYLTREEAERAGRESGHSYWVFEGLP
jgi:hypothetical protein